MVFLSCYPLQFQLLTPENRIMHYKINKVSSRGAILSSSCLESTATHTERFSCPTLLLAVFSVVVSGGSDPSQVARSRTSRKTCAIWSPTAQRRADVDNYRSVKFVLQPAANATLNTEQKVQVAERSRKSFSRKFKSSVKRKQVEVPRR